MTLARYEIDTSTMHKMPLSDKKVRHRLLRQMIGDVLLHSMSHRRKVDAGDRSSKVFDGSAVRFQA